MLDGVRGELVLSSFLNGMILMGVGATLLAPLLYALATLRGMRNKRVYPILRMRQQDGRLSPVEEFPGKRERAWQDC
ncbi:MAG TPA: hypothetical protein VFL31_04500 [Nitrospiraceae bacterium]|nr:hypothetical protein [Nitrospiraceae bacterium]